MVLKTTDPRARPAFHFFKTGYIATAMPAHAKYPMIESNTPAATWFGCAETGEVIRTSQTGRSGFAAGIPAVAIMKPFCGIVRLLMCDFHVLDKMDDIAAHC